MGFDKELATNPNKYAKSSYKKEKKKFLLEVIKALYTIREKSLST